MDHGLGCPLGSFLAVQRQFHWIPRWATVSSWFGGHSMVGAHWGSFCSVLGDTPEDPEFNCSFNSSSDFYKDPILCFNLHPDYFCFIDYAKAFDCVDHNKLWKIFKEMETSDHLTCLLRTLHAGQEATIRTGHGATDWFQIGKGVRQGCILSPCLFNLYA